MLILLALAEHVERTERESHAFPGHTDTFSTRYYVNI